MLNSAKISLETIDNTMVIRFINPKERNPLSIAVLEELLLILDGVVNQPDINKIIFTGSEDVFASGANLREISKIAADNAREFAERGQSLMNKLAKNSKTTIAAVNGFCFGGALDLALSCQRRIASPTAVFCHPGANLGIITGWGGTQRLPRLVGEGIALEMFMTAKRVGAEEALRIGLINEIAEDPLARAVRKIE